MFKSTNKILLWKNTGQIIALLIIMAAQIAVVELSVMNVTKGSRKTRSTSHGEVFDLDLDTKKYNDLADQIKLGNFGKASEMLRLSRYQDEMLAPVIKRSYNDLRDFKNIKKFLNELSSYSRIQGYSALLHQMTVNGHLHNEEILELAIQIKKMEGSNQVLANSARSKLPALIQKIVWQNECTIKNIGMNEYLYEPNDYFALNENTRPVFTWIPGNVVNNGYWIFEPAGVCSTCFFIKNTRWNDFNYLTIDRLSHGTDYRLVGRPIPSGKHQEEFTWKLEPQTISNQNVFILRNFHFDNDNLRLGIAGEFDSDRRNTRLASYYSSSYFHWIIEPLI